MSPLKDPEKRKQYEKQYASTHPEKRQEINKRWKDKNKTKVLACAKRHKERYPEQTRAVAIAQKIPKAERCKHCGSATRLQKHHSDYSKPREFITLCVKCHQKLHREVEVA